MDGHNASKVKLESRDQELEKQFEHSALLVRDTEFNYLLFLNDSEMLKQRQATGVSDKGEMEQRLINASIDVVG